MVKKDIKNLNYQISNLEGIQKNKGKIINQQTIKYEKLHNMELVQMKIDMYKERFKNIRPEVREEESKGLVGH